MINNRQQNGRRRGRGGQRPQGNPGQPGGGGSRIDNRARGNAQQLHEKYKNLAQDAQRAGDRVTTEYYLQFADHYFRVLSESRARFEEQRPQNQGSDEEYEGEDGGDEFDTRDQGRDQGREQHRDQGRDQNRQPRNDRNDRGDRNERNDRTNDRGDRNSYRRDDQRQERQPERAEAGEQVERDVVAPQQDEGERRTRRPRSPREDEGQQPEALGIDRLPPAIAVTGEEGEEAAAPRRRGRRPRPEVANDTAEIPPAA